MMAVTSTDDFAAEGAGFAADGAGCGAAEGAEAAEHVAPPEQSACAASGSSRREPVKPLEPPELPKPPELRDRILRT